MKEIQKPKMFDQGSNDQYSEVTDDSMKICRHNHAFMETVNKMYDSIELLSKLVHNGSSVKYEETS